MHEKTKRPSKQKKRFFDAKLHELAKHMSSTLSKELRKSMKKRSIGLRKGDKVTVMRGKFKKKTGKVGGVNRVKRQVFIEGMMRKKADGKEIFVPIHPSNIMIVELAAGDKKRGVVVSKETSKAVAEPKIGGQKVSKNVIEKKEKAVLSAKAR